MKHIHIVLLGLLPLGVFAEDADLEKLGAAAGTSAQGAFEYGTALQEQGRHADAVRSFRKALELDAKHEAAHKALGHQLIDGRWVTRAERDAPRRAARLKELSATGKTRFDHETTLLDCTADGPFLVCMEDSPDGKDGERLDLIRDYLKALVRLFKDRFGDLCDVDDLMKGEVCFVYVFSDRQRYLDRTPPPLKIRPGDDDGGHFDCASSTLYMYKDPPQLLEMLCREGALQLLTAATQRVEEDSSKRRDASMGWFTEGVATDFGSFRWTATATLALGADNISLVYFAQKMAEIGQDLKLSEFLGITDSEFAKKKLDALDRPALESQAWAFWYFLKKADFGRYQKKLDRYIAREMEQKGGLEAAKTCFGDLDALDAEYREFIKIWKR